MADQDVQPQASGANTYNAASMKRIVDAARQRAMDTGRPKVADAIHNLWLESLRNARLADLLHSILNRNATPEQTADFRMFMQRVRERQRDAAKIADVTLAVEAIALDHEPPNR